MENFEYVNIDPSGRVVIPKSIRKKIGNKKTLTIYFDEEHKDIHLRPVKKIEEFVGAFKGIKQQFKKDHEADWIEYPDR